MNNPVFKKIFRMATPLLKKGRWYDLGHTKYSVKFMEEILSEENKLKKENILIPTIILHDIGWSEIGKEKNTQWSKLDLRIKHMEIGAKLAEQILKKIGYPTKLTIKIKKLVKTHDNFYLGIEPKTDEEKIMRDADGCFSFTSLSFWKDYDVKIVKNKLKTSPKEFLKKLTVQYGKMYTKTGQKIVEKLIKERLEEIQSKNK